MARRSRSNTQEDTVTTTEENATETNYDGNTFDPAEAPAEDVDVETLPEADDEVEDIPATAEGDEKPAKAKKEKAQPKRGELPDGYVTPIGLTKAINERGLYRNRDGEVAELKPQMVYSYIKNAPKDHPYPGETVKDSVGAERENCVTLDAGLEWWTEKNKRAEERRQNAANKAAKKAEKASAKAEPAEDESPAVVEEAE